jgi:nitrous oxidase accessory protein
VLHGREWHVGAGHPFATIQSALDAAAAGDAIHVHGGRHLEAVLVSKPVQLLGVGGPVLDGELKREIVIVTASDVIVSGFTIRDGGRSSTSDFAGIRVESARGVRIEGNRVNNCAFGIALFQARECLVQANTIDGIPGAEQSSGNGIHLWSCDGVRIRSNTVRGHRDGIYLEFASQSVVEDNAVEDSIRYGLHFMFSSHSTYRGNRFDRNGAGVAVMYSREVAMLDNTFARSWGASAYGLLLKDITDSQIRGNTFLRNTTAIYAQGATRVRFERNVLRENGWALRLLGSGQDNSIETNCFVGNAFDVATNGYLVNHHFSGNYWDRYEGYDLNRDGLGDVPFRPIGLFASLVERVPSSVVLSRSFMAQLLDRAEKAFPSIDADHVTDPAPLQHPTTLNP